MMLFFNTVTKEYPRHIADLELLGWKQGESLPENWVQVEYTEPPLLQENEAIQELEPKNVDGIYYQNLIVRPMTEKEIALKNLSLNLSSKLQAAGFSAIEIEMLRTIL